MAEDTVLDNDEFQTVCTVATETEAEVIRGALSNEGIRSVIEGAQQAGFAGTLGIPIKVQVRAADFDRASQFIEQHDQAVHDQTPRDEAAHDEAISPS